MLKTIILTIGFTFTAIFLYILVLAFITGIEMIYLDPIRARKKFEKELEQWEKEHLRKDKK